MIFVFEGCLKKLDVSALVHTLMPTDGVSCNVHQFPFPLFVLKSYSVSGV